MPAAGESPMSVVLELATAPRAVAADGRASALAPLDAAILAWLALEGPTPRARIAALLWPDKDAEAARNSLRQRLFQLRKQVGVDLIAGSTTLSLAGGVPHDLDDADTVLGQAAGEDLAPGEYAQWLERQRARRRDRVRHSLVELAEMAEQAKDWDDALTHAKELLALEPLSEDAHRRVMRLHYLAGDRAAALLAFDRCEQVLKDEVGARPSAETLALLETVQSAALQTLPSRAAAGAALLRPPRLVGRDAEWAELARAVEAMAFVVIEGEAGLGKSRLVGDFARRAPQASIVVGARPGDVGVPYASIVRLVRVLVQRIGEPPAALRHTLARLVPEFGEPGPAPDDTARLHAALESFVGSAGARGVHLVVVEDLHFADAASAEALHFLTAAARPLAWVFTTRPHAASSPRAHRITLAPLTEAQIAELVDSLAVTGWSGAALAPRLARHTGGNPLFLLETLKSMPLGVAALAPSMPVVQSVTQLVGQRIARLSPPAVRIARCAALAGQDFSVELATHLLGVGPLDLADAWAELEAAHVLHEQTFAHDLIRDAAQASVPAPLARELHRQIAQYLEGRDAAPERIAAHWQASPEPGRAAPHLMAAGRQAVKMLRWDEAADALLSAAELLERSGDRAAAFEAVDGFFGHVRSPSAAANDRLLERLRALADTPLQRARAAERDAGVLSQHGEFAAAGAVADAALAGFRHEQAPALASMLMQHAASGHLQRGDNAAAVRTMYRAVTLAETSQDEEAQQRATSTLAVVLNVSGSTVEAEPHFVRAFEIAKRRGQPMDIIDAALEMASLRSATGHLDSAREHFEFAERLAASHALEVERLWPWMPLRRVGIAFRQARYGDAVASLEHTAAVLAERMPGWSIALDNIAIGLWMQLGQWARARQASHAALARCTGALPLHAATAQARTVELDLAQGQGGDALAAIDRALAHVGSGRKAQQLALMRTGLVAADEALDSARRLGAEARARGTLGAALDAEVMACEAALRVPDAASAVGHAHAALALLESVEPAELYRGRIWLTAASALGPADPTAAERLVRQAAHWIAETARERVPAEFRDSFLHRNPVNRELLALASRLR